MLPPQMNHSRLCLGCDRDHSLVGSQYGCFGPHPSMIAVLRSAKTNHTRGENELNSNSAGLYRAALKIS